MVGCMRRHSWASWSFWKGPTTSTVPSRNWTTITHGVMGLLLVGVVAGERDVGASCESARPDLELASAPGEGRARQLECPGCGSDRAVVPDGPGQNLPLNPEPAPVLEPSLRNTRVAEAETGASGLEVLRRKDVLAERDRALDRQLELTNIAGPGLAREPGPDQGRYLRWPPVSHGLAQEAKSQGLDVCGPLSKRRNLEHDASEPLHEVVAKPAEVNEVGEVPAGGRDDANVNRDERRGAEPTDGALFESAQELRLQMQAELGDLVEEQRAVVGLLEQARDGARGAGESAAHVAEELTLGQTGRNRRAVEGHERPTAAAGLVDGVGEHFLAGASLTEDEDRQSRRCDPVDEGEQPAHGLADRDDVVAPVPGPAAVQSFHGYTSLPRLPRRGACVKERSAAPPDGVPSPLSTGPRLIPRRPMRAGP